MSLDQNLGDVKVPVVSSLHEAVRYMTGNNWQDVRVGEQYYGHKISSEDGQRRLGVSIVFTVKNSAGEEAMVRLTRDFGYLKTGDGDALDSASSDAKLAQIFCAQAFLISFDVATQFADMMWLCAPNIKFRLSNLLPPMQGVNLAYQIIEEHRGRYIHIRAPSN